MTEEQAKKIKKKDKESSELKGELTEDELNSVSGGRGVTEQSVNNWIDERIHFLDPSA
jgi:bacteriocin-like protein